MHLYIHVPFCARRCSYCDFAIAVRKRVPSGEFLTAILREWEAWQVHPAWRKSPGVETIYFGGGTPSRLDPAVVGKLLQRFRADRDLSADAEVTLETNPDDVTPDTVGQWIEAGITRVSLGGQSFSAPALGWMHRTHSADQIGQAVKTLQAAGMTNLSLDLIYGLPIGVRRDWSSDLDRCLELGPQHISLYALTIEPHTPLSHWVARGESIPVPDHRVAEEYLEAHRRLDGAGYEHYEVSNAARPGFRSRHNSAYWTRRPYVGLGPSAHSALGNLRSWNVRDWEDYRRRAGDQVAAGSELLTEEQVELEELYLGLRTSAGVAESRLGVETVASWCAEGWATVGEGTVRLTPEGWLRLDALVAGLTHC